MILKLRKKVLFLTVGCLLALAVIPSVDRLGGYGCGTALAQEGEVGPGAAIHELMGQAKKLGAKGQLPHTWWNLDSRLDAAEKSGATVEQWALRDKLRVDLHSGGAATVYHELLRGPQSAP